MRHACTLAAGLLVFLVAFAALLLATGHTALVDRDGLLQVIAFGGAAALMSATAAWILARVERRRAERWSLSAHPLTWLVAPAALILAILAVGYVARQASRPSLHGDWSIGIYLSAGTEPEDFAPLGPQPVITPDLVDDLPCAFVADPVLVRSGGGYQLFFEAWNTRSGHGDIALATSPDGQRWTYRGRVLDEDCSLSYPTVFQHAGTWYMIPESRALAELRLYRADPYPDRWVLDRVLLTGARYRDTNIVEHDGHWYLLTTTDHGSELLVYHADTPLGPWQPHPGNPVVEADPDHARGGGSIVAHTGRLWRFAQDVHPYYGNRVWTMRVDTLSRSAFAQSLARPAPALVGHDAWNVRGMHTLWCVQRDDGRWLAAVDGFGRNVDTRQAWRD